MIAALPTAGRRRARTTPAVPARAVCGLFAGVWLLLATVSAAALDASQLGVVYDTDNPHSVELARYYAERRGVPAAQVVGVALGRKIGATLSVERFTAVKAELERRLPDGVQALALAWTQPYRVDCMSVTAAFTLGFDPAYCAKGCAATRASPYFDKASSAPWQELGIRPSMLLAARTPSNARLLVERGIASDGRHPPSRAYLVITNDAARNSRSARFAAAERWFGQRYPIVVEHSRGLRDVHDIMFYFTGATRVPHLDTLGFLPGAIADHLTSHGGRLLDSSQMSVLDWLEAGATGSYGTVVEPCNFPQKFPDPVVAIGWYLNGETLLEAYWKSVAWPGQGVFVGEPLARPFGPPAGTAPAP